MSANCRVAAAPSGSKNHTSVTTTTHRLLRILQYRWYYAYPDAASYVGLGNPDACQKVVDFGYRHLYETPVIAKNIIEHYYQKALRNPITAAARVVAKRVKSALSYSLSSTTASSSAILWEASSGYLRGTWDTFWGADLAKQADSSCTGFGCPSVYAQYKAALHYKTVYDKCDAVDGLVDGIIDDLPSVSSTL